MNHLDIARILKSLDREGVEYEIKQTPDGVRYHLEGQVLSPEQLIRYDEVRARRRLIRTVG